MSLFTFFRAAPGLFESFGFVKEQPVFMSIVLFQLLQGPLDEVSPRPALAVGYFVFGPGFPWAHADVEGKRRAGDLPRHLLYLLSLCPAAVMLL